MPVPGLTDGPCHGASPPPPAPLSATSGSSSAAAISAHVRALTSPSRRPATLAVSASSDLRSADPVTRAIRSSRILASSA